MRTTTKIIELLLNNHNCKRNKKKKKNAIKRSNNCEERERDVYMCVCAFRLNVSKQQPFIQLQINFYVLLLQIANISRTCCKSIYNNINAQTKQKRKEMKPANWIRFNISEAVKIDHRKQLQQSNKFTCYLDARKYTHICTRKQMTRCTFKRTGKK